MCTYFVGPKAGAQIDVGGSAKGPELDVGLGGGTKGGSGFMRTTEINFHIKSLCMH